jgi:hypothetical protein
MVAGFFFALFLGVYGSHQRKLVFVILVIIVIAQILAI